MAALILVVFAALAVGADLLSVEYHDAREGDRTARASLIASGLEAIGWIPVLGAISAGSVTMAWAIAGVCVVGSAIGTAAGMARVRRRSGDADPED